jgi:hypothetical protein
MILLALTIAWLGVGLWMWMDGIADAAFIGLFVAGTWAAVGFGLFVVALILVAQRYRRPLHGAVAVLVAAGGVAIATNGSRLARAGIDLRFLAARSDYETIVRRVELGANPPGDRAALDIDYLVDRGPPRRVAFRIPGGILDNWCAVVHDRTGSLKNPTPAMTKIFGGDLLDCRAFDEVFFLCCFT